MWAILNHYAMSKAKINTVKKGKDDNEEFGEKIKKDLLFRVFKELGSLNGQPRIQLFIAHGFLELLINALIKAKAKNGKKITDDTRSYPYASQLLILHEIGELTDQDYILYTWFRKLRNKAAHEPLFNLTIADFDPTIKEEYRSIDKFYSVCEDLMLRLWNKNKDILVPVFVPTLAAKKEK
ncbi:MAG: hypothetical protein C0459_06470 [Chitinophaga sp.]|nr:hypothetical protein [Chitinophaga sp.]